MPRDNHDMEIALDQFNKGEFHEALRTATEYAENTGFHGAYHLCAAAAREIGRKSIEFENAKNAVKALPCPKYVKSFAISIMDQELWVDALKLFMELSATGDIESQCNAAWCFFRIGYTDDAISLLKTIIGGNPQEIKGRGMLGSIYHQTGRFSKAEDIYRGSFGIDIRTEPSLWFHITANKKYTDISDQDIKAMEDLLPRIENKTKEDKMGRVYVNFALSKAYADCGAHEHSFNKLACGTKIRRSIDGFNIEAVRKQTGEIIEFNFDGVDGCQDYTPIFIIGMPRSGTTLIEQILNSHPEIFGAGELNYISDIAVDGRAYPECVDITKAKEIGEEYIRRTRLMSSDRHIVDKMPHNFLYAGLIHAALPNAKIIHCKRDPISTCWSNFITCFHNNLNYSNDLVDVGLYYLEYERLMTHWQSYIPMLTVNYEDMVLAPEDQVRSLLEYIGIPFSGKCLRHYEHAGEIRTASAEQARKPIYRESLAKWQPYREYINKLFKTLGT